MLASFAAATALAASPPVCEPGVNMPGGDLHRMPLASASAAACSALCSADPACVLFSWHAPACSYYRETCALAGGCCWLKSVEAAGRSPQVNNCSCSSYLRLPSVSKRNGDTTPGPGAKNVLYLLVDDLRPQFAAYRQPRGHSPHISALASSGTTFDNAYCQISVCSPSRMSFLTGRRPDHSRVLNFIDHFRQADCGLTEGGVAYLGPTLRNVTVGGCEWGGAAPCGGSGDCCSICSEDERCGAWTYTHTNSSCMLKARSGARAADSGAVSGARGTLSTRAAWVSLPQHFKRAGWIALSSGKIFHTEEGGSGNTNPNLNGPGMPPNQDPPSWTPGLSMQRVNDVANMWDCKIGLPPSDPDACAVDADMSGAIASPLTTKQFCDRVIADDAVLKLRLAAMHTPFFLAVGFRKPHLPFRFPAPFLALVEGDVAAHPTLSPTVPPIAHHDAVPQPHIYTPVANATAHEWRRHYRAAIAWVDSQIGRVLHELEARGLAPTTLVALHSDHGWSLGEHGEWQKFSNFEHGTRVPLIMRAPWVRESVGTRSSVLAELIDIFPTMAELAGAPLDPQTAASLDGTSLAPVLRAPADAALARALKHRALSQYMRCPRDAAQPQKANDCLFTDRSQIAFMGYTVRTHTHRFTQWAAWNGSSLRSVWQQPRWPDIGEELYSHVGDDGSDFDRYENKNCNASEPNVAAALRVLLHEAVANGSAKARVDLVLVP